VHPVQPAWTGLLAKKARSVDTDKALFQNTSSSGWRFSMVSAFVSLFTVLRRLSPLLVDVWAAAADEDSTKLARKSTTAKEVR